MPPQRILRVVILILASISLVLTACSLSATETKASDPSPAVPKVSSTPTEAPQAAPTDEPSEPDNQSGTCPATSDMDIDPSAILEMGPGPGIPSSNALGEKLVISGAVYAQDCTPLAGAVLEVWQTGANGEYGPGHGTNDMVCCYLMGSVTTDSAGRYQLVTTMPAHYKGETTPPPAHIHVRIIHPDASKHETEIVFKDDPYLPANLQNFIVVSLEPVPEDGNDGANLRGIADIIVD